MCDGAKVEKGGWCGGDVWFGNVMSAIKLFVRLGVNSTFVIKKSDILFPTAELHVVLKACHSNYLAGHW